MSLSQRLRKQKAKANIDGALRFHSCRYPIAHRSNHLAPRVLHLGGALIDASRPAYGSGTLPDRGRRHESVARYQSLHERFLFLQSGIRIFFCSVLFFYSLILFTECGISVRFKHAGRAIFLFFFCGPLLSLRVAISSTVALSVCAYIDKI